LRAPGCRRSPSFAGWRSAEFKKVVYKTDIQGKDLITALAETAKESASTVLRETLWDLANMIHQGGNLDAYLRGKSDDVLKLKRLGQREFIERLSTFLDMYVSLVLIGVLMIAVGAYLVNAFGSTIGPLDANSLLIVLAYGIVPLSVTMTVILISIAYARAD
jgi:archaellum biogenesis protein FlaJ (TadC family)